MTHQARICTPFCGLVLVLASVGLAQDLRRDVLVILDDDAAGIDHFKMAAIVFGRPMYAVASNPRLIADNRPPLSRDAVEEGGLSNVGPAHNDHCGNGVGHEVL